MELMPVYSVSNLEAFLVEAKENGWSILGSSASPETREESEEGSHRNRKEESRGKKMPQVDCRSYVKQGPTLLVLGTSVQ
jgi:tRNA G18 (ribose-2'-O)-methylase SpoU